MKRIILIFTFFLFGCIKSASGSSNSFDPASLYTSQKLSTSAIQYPAAGDLPSVHGFPDPFLFFDGVTRVNSREDWFNRRRPELKQLFQHYMYGFMPTTPPQIQARVVRVEPAFFGGKATKKEVEISFGFPGGPVVVLLMVTPNNRIGPAPVFVGSNTHGNQVFLPDPNIYMPSGWVPDDIGVVNNRATDASRRAKVGNLSLERSIDNGFAVATFYNGDIDPDREIYNDGIQSFYFQPGQTTLGEDEWGTLAAWAWGLQRAVDYLMTDPNIDQNRIIAVGHSRNGKVALLAAAFDERIDLVISHQAGLGGSGPSRSTVGETIEGINSPNTGFPNWFNGVFKQFNGRSEKLPFDQHELVGLVAPRPVLFTAAIGDEWSNPPGQFDVLQAADPIYRFLGAEGLAPGGMPEPGRLVSSNLGYYIRTGVHSMGPEDWDVFYAFARAHLAISNPPQPGPLSLSVLASPAQRSFSVQAMNVLGNVHVDFYDNGQYIRTENLAPYCLFGDDGSTCTLSSLIGDGNHIISVNVVDNFTAAIVAQAQLSVTQGSMSQGVSLSVVGNPAQRSFSVQAMNVSGNVHVDFYDNGQYIRTENLAPYCLFGDDGIRMHAEQASSPGMPSLVCSEYDFL
jgi:hypothetical protein